MFGRRTEAISSVVRPITLRLEHLRFIVCAVGRAKSNTYCDRNRSARASAWFDHRYSDVASQTSQRLTTSGNVCSVLCSGHWQIQNGVMTIYLGAIYEKNLNTGEVTMYYFAGSQRVALRVEGDPVSANNGVF